MFKGFGVGQGHLSKKNSQRLKHLWPFEYGIISQTSKTRRRAAKTRIRGEVGSQRTRLKKHLEVFKKTLDISQSMQMNRKSNTQHQNVIKLHPVQILQSQLYLSPNDNLRLDGSLGDTVIRHPENWEMTKSQQIKM